MNRQVESTEGFELIRDEHPARGAEISFLRWSGDNRASSFVLVPTFDVHDRVVDDAVGTLLHGSVEGLGVTLWIPRNPERVRFDEHGRPGSTRSPADGWTLDSDGGQVRVSRALDSSDDSGELVLPFVRIDDADGKHFRDLTGWSDAERRTYRVSEWFEASSLASIWDYLIDGDVYDPRASDTTGGRFKCQQCACAWWYYLQALGCRTGKEIYGLLRDEVAWSILLDLDQDGAWHHGSWWEGMETHARFQLDGIDLLVFQHQVTGEGKWLEGADRGMRYVLEHLTDSLDDGLLWFLHDSMEGRQDHRLRARWLGRSPGNSLCLNTHLQALKVLYRLQEREPDGEAHGDAYRRGMEALRRVLEHQPAGAVYGPLMREILDEKVPIAKKRVLQRARRRLMKPLRRRLYWHMQERYPRLVHPNGFIDRDLSLSCASDRYHVTNLKDLLKLYELTKEDWLKVHIEGALDFTREYLARRGLDDALRGSPYFIEVVDIMLLYSRLVEPLPTDEIESLREGVLEATGAHSLEGELTWADPKGGG